MAPTEENYCSDPFKTHKNVSRSDLRKVSALLARRWPSFVRLGQNVCSTCRKKLYRQCSGYIDINTSFNVDTGPKEIEEKKTVHVTSCASMSKDRKCDYCGVGNEREVELGTLHIFDDVAVHYFCLLFSSGLPQNGEDDEGILGFLVPDIVKEMSRGKKLHCSFCSKRGATIGCSEKKCRRSYHYACGLRHHALYRFTGDFRSYCQQHRSFQKGKGIGQNFECPICMDDLIADPKTAVWAPCCNKKTWFHKLCVQQLALSAGYFFKCPLCNDKEIFVEEMQNVGIYVPEKDASWELEPNAYSELERPIRCDAQKCKCPDGRKRDDIGTRWEILLCNLCGASGIHISCGKLRFTSSDWSCETCTNMLSDSVKRMQQEVRERRLKERKKREEEKQSSEEEEEESQGETAGCCSTALGEAAKKIFAEEDSMDETSRDILVNASQSTLTPKRKLLDVADRTEETPPKICHRDFMDTFAKVTYASDSDEEIDVELGEYLVPPHTIIRELEESGEELSKQLKKLRNYAVRAQERMNELRLTEMEIVQMARDSSSYRHYPLDKATVMKFFRYSLPLDKMLQALKVIRAIYSVREAQVISARTSGKKKKPASASKRRSWRSKCLEGVPDIAITLSKSALSKTMTTAGVVSRAVHDLFGTSTSNCTVNLERLEEDYHGVKNALEESEDTNRLSDVNVSLNLFCEKDKDKLERNFSASVCEPNLWDYPTNSPRMDLRLDLSFSPLEKTPVFFRNLQSAAASSPEASPTTLKNWKRMNKENACGKLDVVKEEVDELRVQSLKRPLEESNTIIVPCVESTPDNSGISSQQSLDDRYESGSRSENVEALTLSESSLTPKRRGRPKGSKTKKRLSLGFDCYTPVKSSPRLERLAKDRAIAEIPECVDSIFGRPQSDKPPKKKRSRSHDCSKYVQKTLTSYFMKQSDNAQAVFDTSF